MKIALILSGSLKYAPYAKYYINLLEENKIEYDVISWNRGMSDEGAKYTFKTKQDGKNALVAKVQKAINYFRYSSFVQKVCRGKDYDCLIIFTVQMGLILSRFLLKTQKRRYIFDIRDYSKLDRYMHKLLDKLLYNSVLNVVSSQSFEKWLLHECTVCHNVDYTRLNNISSEGISDPVIPPYKVASIGNFLESDINIELLKQLLNNKLFCFYYIGKANIDKEKLKKYVNDYGVMNVKMMGAYSPDETDTLYRHNCDFVNIIRRESAINKYALPNKLYNGIILGKPIITNRANIAIADLIDRYYLGIILDEPFSSEAIINEINAFDRKAFIKGRERFLHAVFDEQMLFKKNVIDALSLKKAL